MYGRTTTDEGPTTERFIDLIVERVPRCSDHHKKLDPILDTSAPLPCYTLPISITKDAVKSENWGVCNARARKAGFIGEPAPKPKKFHSKWNPTQGTPEA